MASSETHRILAEAALEVSAGAGAPGATLDETLFPARVGLAHAVIAAGFGGNPMGPYSGIARHMAAEVDMIAAEATEAEKRKLLAWGSCTAGLIFNRKEIAETMAGIRTRAEFRPVREEAAASARKELREIEDELPTAGKARSKALLDRKAVLRAELTRLTRALTVATK